MKRLTVNPFTAFCFAIFLIFLGWGPGILATFAKHPQAEQIGLPKEKTVDAIVAVGVVQLYFVAPPPSGDTSGATDTAVLQALVTPGAVPDTAAILFPSPAVYYLNAQINFFGRNGVRLISFGQPDTLALGKRGCEFIWVGPTGVGSMFYLASHRSTMEGFAFSVDGSPTPPTNIVTIDSAVPAGVTTPVVSVTTNTIRRCLFTAAVGQPVVHINLSPTAKNLCDLSTFDTCVFNNGVAGILCGASSNAKQERIRDCQFNGCQWAIHFLNGSALIRDCTAQSCGVSATTLTPAFGGDLVFDAYNDFGLASGWNSEGCKGLPLSIQSTSAPFEVQCSRFDGPTGPATAGFFRTPTAGAGVAIRSCYFAGPTTTPFFLPGGRTAGAIILDNTRSNGSPSTVGTPPTGQYGGFQQFGGVYVGNGSSGF